LGEDGEKMTVAIANDTLQGMPQVGTDIGAFLSNLAPGIGVFILILGVFGGLVAIVYGVVMVVKNNVSKNHK